MRTVRSVVEIGLGLLYAVGAVFHVVYTLRHSEELFGAFAEGAWLSPARLFIRQIVIPNGRLFTVLLIVFQATVAVAILSRGGPVRPALLVGGAFALAVAFFSSPGGTVGNLLLAGIQYALALSR